MIISRKQLKQIQDDFSELTLDLNETQKKIDEIIVGEIEAYKNIGIVINPERIKKLAREKGIKREIDKQTKAELILELIEKDNEI